MLIKRFSCLAALFVCISGYAEAPQLPTLDSGHWTEEYDPHFRKYSKRYFGVHFDWRWFKAQAVAESNLRHNARSHVGAQGIMQLMPRTFDEVKEANPHFLDISDPRWNIAAGIYYDRVLYRKWVKRVENRDHLMLTFASYNAGFTGMLRAYKRAPGPVQAWEDIEPHVAKETRNYVQRIRHLRRVSDSDSAPADKSIWGMLTDWTDSTAEAKTGDAGVE